MTATAFLELKQRAAKRSERERQDLSAYLIRLGQDRAGWKKETARRLNEMAKSRKTSVAELRGGGLDPTAALGDVARMKPASVKVVGQLRKTPWQRFARLQRTAAKLARGRGQPKGVFRFSSNEACDAWTASLNRTGK